jgi:hypothetical protein
MHLSSVVFPEAFGPSKLQREPHSTLKVMSRRTGFFRCPKPSPATETSSLISITPCLAKLLKKVLRKDKPAS